MVARLFDRLLRRRLVLLALVGALSGVLGAYASRVRPDYSVEHLFPVRDPAREVYDRYKQRFPFEDTRAIVIVESADLFTPAGVRRVAALEADLKRIPHVVDVEGLLSSNDIRLVDEAIQVEPLIPSVDTPADEILRRAEAAATDPSFAWNVVTPDRSAASVRVLLDPVVAATDRGRADFLVAAEGVLARHAHAGQRLVLSGIPAIRASFARLLGEDSATLVPAALLVVLALLAVSFRSAGAVVAGLFTIVAAIVWTHGWMGILGYPITMLGTILPIVVMIISISDTVHIVNDYLARLRAGEDRHHALVEALAETAVPCLLTEIVLACGFASLLTVNIVAVFQFGVVAAGGMLLTWLANMLVLPLVLGFVRAPKAQDRAAVAARAPFAVRRLAQLVDWIAVQVTTHRRRVIGVTAALFALAALAGTRVTRLAYVFDDLRPGLPLYKDLRIAETAHGGLVPVAVFVEVEGGGEHPAFDPEAVRVADAAARMLRGFPEIAQANSLADPLRKTHRLMTGVAAAAGDDGLPKSRALVAQEVSTFDDGRMLRDLVSFDRRSLSAIGFAKDAGSTRIAAMFKDIDAWIVKEQARLDARKEGPRIRVTVTGQLKLFKDVNDMLLEGLLSSFGGALLVTFAVFCLVLRSVKLGLIGLIPNVTPMVIVVALMAALGIHLKPATVVLFSVTLVIADDDTIQYLARYKLHLRRAIERARGEAGLDVHEAAALSCMREVGLPMFVTSTTVSAGFFLLLGSRFMGLAHLGFLIGATLFAAVFADLFLTPILLTRFRPSLGLDVPKRDA